MSVIVTRLITGEEILGKAVLLKDESSSCVKIENPTLISAVRNPNTGNVDVLMAPFAPLSEDKIVLIEKHHVVCQYSPVVEVVNKYNTMFGSGLIIPSTSGIQTV